MASREWIDSAARPDRDPAMVGGESFGGTLLAGATSIQLHHAGDEQRAARLAARAGPDIAEALGLEPPPKPRSVIALLGHDALEGVLAAVAAGEDAGRTAARGLLPIEVEAARRALQDRREGR